jgi:hypothetical protein
VASSAFASDITALWTKNGIDPLAEAEYLAGQPAAVSLAEALVRCLVAACRSGWADPEMAKAEAD